MRKVDNGEKKRAGKKEKEIITNIVSSNVVASLPPERRPTEAQTTRAKKSVCVTPVLYVPIKHSARCRVTDYSIAQHSIAS